MFAGYVESMSCVCWDMVSQCLVFAGYVESMARVCWDMVDQRLVFAGICWAYVLCLLGYGEAMSRVCWICCVNVSCLLDMVDQCIVFDGYIGSMYRVWWDMLGQCLVFGGICWVNVSCLVGYVGSMTHV